MASRLRYPELAPEGYAALTGFGHYLNTGTALEPVLLGLVYLRASVLNGCEFCTELHKAELRKHHEPEGRIEAAGASPEADVFTPRERAALRWTTELTNVQHGHASDAAYADIGTFFQGKDLVDLTFAIANINAWNRMGIAFRPQWRARPSGPRPETSPAASTSQGSQAGDHTRKQNRPTEPLAEPVSNASHDEDDGGKVDTD